MDKFTKRYIMGLAAIGAIILGFWMLGGDPRVRELNDLLKRDTEIAAYPFPFHVTRLENGIATVTSPRSPEFSVLKFIGLAWPDLEGLDGNRPEVIAAQKRLARIQGKVGEILKKEPDVKAVNWVLDRDWFEERGIVFYQ